MHVDVPGTEVLFDHHLVLLRISAAHDEVVLGRDEPVELLEPVRLARHLEAPLVRLFDQPFSLAFFWSVSFFFC